MKQICSLTSFMRCFASLQGLKPIRALDIEKADDPDHQEIQRILRIVNVVEAPEFVALLYVWKVFDQVTSNRWSALWHLQRRLGAVAVWIDSICINQDDDEVETS